MIKPYYEDDSCTIYHADCREILPELEAESVDLVLTDPPYVSGARRDANAQVRGSMLRGLEDVDWFSHDAMTSWGFSWFVRSVFTALVPALSPGAHSYVFTDWRQTPNVYGLLESCGYRVNNCLVWEKPGFGMGTYWRNQHEMVVFASWGQPAPMLRRDRGTILKFKGVGSQRRIHPTEKPPGLLAHILDAVPGETVIDPFMGSGPVLAAAKNLGRRAIGIEIEEKYCEIAARRLQQEVLPLGI